MRASVRAAAMDSKADITKPLVETGEPPVSKAAVSKAAVSGAAIASRSPQWWVWVLVLVSEALYTYVTVVAWTDLNPRIVGFGIVPLGEFLQNPSVRVVLVVLVAAVRLPQFRVRTVFPSSLLAR